MDEIESRPHTTSLQNPTRGRKTTPSFSHRLGSTEIPWSGTWQGQQKLQPLALPRLPHGFYRFPERSIKAFGVLGFFPPSTSTEMGNKVLYPLPSTISLNTALSAGRHYLQLSFVWKEEISTLITSLI